MYPKRSWKAAVAYCEKKSPAKRQKKQAPADQVSPGEWRPEDVVCGRNSKWAQHPGNQNYRDLISANVDRYMAAKNYRRLPSLNPYVNTSPKLVIVDEVIDQVQSSGGRFLDHDKHRDLWFIMERTKVQRKVAQNFRDYKKLGALSASLLSRQEGIKTPIVDANKCATTSNGPAVPKDADTKILPPLQAKKNERSWKDVMTKIEKNGCEKGLSVQAVEATPDPPSASLSQDKKPACKPATIQAMETTRKRRPPSNSKYLSLDDLRSEDVFSGFNSSRTKHVGNQKFCEYIRANLNRYLTAKNYRPIQSPNAEVTASKLVRGKLVIIDEVIDYIESSGGRFLKYEKHQHFYLIMEQTKVEAMIRAAFQRCNMVRADGVSLLSCQEGEIKTTTADGKRCHSTTHDDSTVRDDAPAPCLSPFERKKRERPWKDAASVTEKKISKGSLPAQAVDATADPSAVSLGRVKEPAREIPTIQTVDRVAVMPENEPWERQPPSDRKYVPENEWNPDDVFHGYNSSQPGNKKLRDLISANAERYMAAKNRHNVPSFNPNVDTSPKFAIVNEVIDHIQSVGGRFLDHDKHQDLWFIMEHTRVQKKVAQNFRDYKRLLTDGVARRKVQTRKATTHKSPATKKEATFRTRSKDKVQRGRKVGPPRKKSPDKLEEKGCEKCLPVKAVVATADQEEQSTRKRSTIKTAEIQLDRANSFSAQEGHIETPTTATDNELPPSSSISMNGSMYFI